MNLPGQIFLDDLDETKLVYNPMETMLFLNIMSMICRKHRRYKERNEYYEPSLFQCEKVWVKRANKRKLSTLYHGPYTVLHASEHSMHIQKNGGVVKVSIRNVKAYFPRENPEDENCSESQETRYNLRERKAVVYKEESSSDEE